MKFNIKGHSLLSLLAAIARHNSYLFTISYVKGKSFNFLSIVDMEGNEVFSQVVNPHEDDIFGSGKLRSNTTYSICPVGTYSIVSTENEIKVIEVM